MCASHIRRMISPFVTVCSNEPLPFTSPRTRLMMSSIYCPRSTWATLSESEQINVRRPVCRVPHMFPPCCSFALRLPGCVPRSLAEVRRRSRRRILPHGAVLKGKSGRGFVTPTETNLRGDALYFMVKTWAMRKTTEALLNNGWRLAASTNGPQEKFAVLRHAAACLKPSGGGGTQIFEKLKPNGSWLVAVSGWRLADGGSGRWAAVGGWRLVVPRGCP